MSLVHCTDCVFNGEAYASGTEWTGGPEDPCTHYKCVAGVVTESQMKCYTPCSNPFPPRPGQCCPTCLGEYKVSYYLRKRFLHFMISPAFLCQFLLFNRSAIHSSCS
jgi:hypothetical protein